MGVGLSRANKILPLKGLLPSLQAGRGRGWVDTGERAKVKIQVQ